MHDPMTFERRLADAYERWAAEMLTDVDAIALVRVTRTHTSPARRGWLTRPMRTVLVLATVAALAVAAAIWVASRPRTETDLGAAAWQMVLARTVDDSMRFVAIRSDGQERLITALPAPDRDREVDLTVSGSGWLAVRDQDRWRLVDLRDPSRVVGPLEELADARGYAWAPDGRFAEWQESGSMRLLDPETGATTMLSLAPPLFDIDAWLADGTGFIQSGDTGGPLYIDGRPRSRDWRAVYLDGRPDARTIPPLDPWPWGTGAAGMVLQLCDPMLDAPCPDLPNGAVVGQAADGTVTTWYRNELAPDDVVDARFTRGGAAMWLLLDRREGGRQFVLAHVDAGETAREVLSGGVLPSDGSMTRIMGVASDDSLVVVGSPPVLVEPLTGRMTVVGGGELLGILPASEVDLWAGGSFAAGSPGPSLAPAFPAWPTLRPMGDIVAEQVPPGTVLWQREQTASDDPDASPSRVVSEPITLEGDLGVMLVCSGPSDVVVTMQPPLPSRVPAEGLVPLVSRCRLGDREVMGGSSEGWVLDQTVRFSVESASDTSWQLVVFDPKPR